jgi:hypothetical protein
MSREEYIELRNHFGGDLVNLLYNYTTRQGLICPPELFYFALQEWCKRHIIGGHGDGLVRILDNHYEVLSLPTNSRILYF